MSDINVIVHFGAEEAAYETSTSETVGAVRTRALHLLKVVVGPNVDYVLTFEGRTLDKDTETLLDLLHGEPKERIELRLDERPKGFLVTVIATSAKEIRAESHELIGTLKRAALRAFGIPEAQAAEYRLATSPGNPKSELPDDKTLAECGVHAGSKEYLIKPHNDA